MQTRKFDELISYFNSKVAEMNIDTKYKMELLGMVTALGFAHEKELTAQTEQHWIPVTERLPEDYQDVLICGEGDFITCAQLIKGIFECGELELYGSIDGTKVIGADTFNVLAWMPLPEAYQPKGDAE